MVIISALNRRAFVVPLLATALVALASTGMKPKQLLETTALNYECSLYSESLNTFVV